jgi:glycosyltransferase involved in cell wall biosynthesis
MNILFIHQNFPAQFKHLAPGLVAAGHEVSALILSKTKTERWLGVNIIKYSLDRGNAENVHAWALDFESKVIRGEACLNACLKLRSGGFIPDVIVAHPGWGESLFVKEVWPDVNLKLYCEFFYHSQGADVGFDSEFSLGNEGNAGRVALKNANILLQFQSADAGVCPTHWQASTFPKHIREKITVIHDGIDTQVLKPRPDVQFCLDTGQTITREDEVITFVNRALEPYRGFHVFLRSLPVLLLERANAQVLIVGEEGVSYGGQPPGNTSWKKIFIDEVFPKLTGSQRARIHFLGTIPFNRFVSLLQVSRVHVYLTYPFVLSWSLLEAMSVGCSIVASDTKPLHEAITHNETGLLVDFFDPEALAESVCSLLDDSARRAKFGVRAREFARTTYDLETVCMPKQMAWVLGDSN